MIATKIRVIRIKETTINIIMLNIYQNIKMSKK